MNGKSHDKIKPEGESPFKSFPAPLDIVNEYTKKYSKSTDVKGGKGLKLTMKFIMFIVQKLSWNVSYKLGAGIGSLLYLCKIRRDIAITNLDIAFGDKKTAAEKEAIYKESLVTFGRVIVNYLRLPFQDEKFWNENCRITNEEILKKAMNKKKGLLMLSGHLGTWDLAAGKLGMSGYPIGVVGKQIANPVINKIVVDARISMNLGTIGTINAMERIFAGLEQGEIIAMALDQNIKQSRGMFINWFGTPASSVRSASYLAREAKIPVLSGAMFQRGPKEFEVIIKNELAWDSYPDDPEKELAVNAQIMSDATEALIADNLGEWFWIHKRWKSQPHGMPDLYKKPRQVQSC